MISALMMRLLKFLKSLVLVLQPYRCVCIKCFASSCTITFFLKFPPNISCVLYFFFHLRACHRARRLSVPDYCTRFFTLCPSPFLKIVNLGTGRKIEVIKYYFAFKADVFVLWFFILPPVCCAQTTGTCTVNLSDYSM